MCVGSSKDLRAVVGELYRDYGEKKGRLEQLCDPSGGFLKEFCDGYMKTSDVVEEIRGEIEGDIMKKLVGQEVERMERLSSKVKADVSQFIYAKMEEVSKAGEAREAGIEEKLRAKIEERVNQAGEVREAGIEKKLKVAIDDTLKTQGERQQELGAKVILLFLSAVHLCRPSSSLLRSKFI